MGASSPAGAGAEVDRAGPGEDPARVSVLIAAYRNAETVAPTLEALRRQSVPPHQVVVVASGGDGTAAVVRGFQPEVELIESEARLFPGSARNRGLARLTGDVVACLDADCVPAADWVERILDALGRGPGAIGGAVVNAPGSGPVAWAYYLSEFTPWLPGRSRALRDAPTCNTAYRAGLIEAAGRFTEEPLLSADSLLHWRLRQRLGVGLRFAPSVRVAHRYVGTAGQLLARRFRHGQSLAAARRRFGPDRLSARLFWGLAGAVLLPPYYVCRLLTRALGHPDVPAAALIRAFPLTVAGLTLWAWGQAHGALRSETSLGDPPGRRVGVEGA
jgi:glycosyltransferase involved in cell wall biosynthesis